MGLLSKIFGGGKPKKQKATAEEKAQAQAAAAKDQRYQTAFAPLELQEIEQYMNPSAKKFTERVLAGRVNADAARAEKDAIGAAIDAAQRSGTTLSSSSNQVPLSQSTIAAAQGEAVGRGEATALAQQARDADAIGIIRTGQDVSRTTTNNLSALARQANFSAGSALRARMTESQARAQALGDIVTAGVSSYDRYRQDKLLEQEIADREKQAQRSSGQRGSLSSIPLGDYS